MIREGFDRKRSEECNRMSLSSRAETSAGKEWSFIQREEILRRTGTWMSSVAHTRTTLEFVKLNLDASSVIVTHHMVIRYCWFALKLDGRLTILRAAGYSFDA